MSTYRSLVLAALVGVAGLAGLAGCKQDDAKAAAPRDIPVAIFQDDRQIATSATLGATPRALVEVAPGAPAPETWLAVIVFDAAGKATTVMTPAKNHPGAAPALVGGADGVTFGLARGTALDAPVAKVTKVVIKTRDDRGAIAAEVKAQQGSGGQGGGDSAGGGHEGGHDHGSTTRPVPTADLKIDLKTAAGESVLTGDKLAGLPEVKAPAGDMVTPGWSFVDVLGAAGLGGAKVVNVFDDNNATLRLEGDDLDPKKTVLYLKLNRSGEFRFRRFAKQGEAWSMTGELRGVRKISVVK